MVGGVFSSLGTLRFAEVELMLKFHSAVPVERPDGSADRGERRDDAGQEFAKKTSGPQSCLLSADNLVDKLPDLPCAVAARAAHAMHPSEAEFGLPIGYTFHCFKSRNTSPTRQRGSGIGDFP